MHLAVRARAVDHVEQNVDPNLAPLYFLDAEEKDGLTWSQYLAKLREPKTFAD